MSDAQTPPPAGSDTSSPHPFDAVLAAIRAVPDSVLRDIEPSTVYALETPPPREEER